MRSLVWVGFAATMAMGASAALAGGHSGGHKGGGHSFSRSHSSSISRSTSFSRSGSFSRGFVGGGSWGGGFRPGGFWGGSPGWGGAWGSPVWSGSDGYRWDRYYRPERGYRLPIFWLSPTYVVTDWGHYRLGSPAYGTRWVRYFDDAVLIDERGNILDARYGVKWGKAASGAAAAKRLDYDLGYDEGYDDGYDDGFEDGTGKGRGKHGAGAWSGHAASHERYGFSNGNVVYAAPGVTTVVVQPQPAASVTTTTYETVYAPRAKSKWRASPRWSGKKKRCVCK